MQKMIWVSKYETKVRQEDGSYREISCGEYMPEAASFIKPDHWAKLVPLNSDEGKRAMALFEKGPVEEAAPSLEESNEEQEVNESEETTKEIIEETKEETEVIEESEKEEIDEEGDFKGVSDKEIRDMALEKFGVKINGTYGRKKVIMKYLELVAESQGE